MSLNSRGDQIFINRLKAIIEANLSNEQFGVSELAHEIGMSRSRLYFKVKSNTQKSVSQFIREIRLNKAMEMLQGTEFNVSEISYKVGFSSPAYFNRCFHELYGLTPGDFRKKTQSFSAGKENSSTDERITDLKNRKVHVKFIRVTIAVLIVLLVGWVIYSQLFKPDESNLSIVVLPFKNLSSDEANQYFADGITEDILHNLYWVTSLRVVSRTSSEHYQGQNYTTREIAKELGVRYVLEGSVRRYDSKVRISVQLIDAEKDDHLWSEYFDRQLDDIIDVQGQIALTVANKLKTVLSEKEIQEIEKISTRNPQAYDYYLRARFLLHKANSQQRMGFDRDGVLNCIQYYEKAIEEDPSFAAAYAGLANASLNLSAWGIIPGKAGFLRARELSVKAIEIDPECAEAHAVLGAFLVWGIREFQNGGVELKKAVELNPNFATARQWYAQYLMITGPLSEARKQINKAVELEPYFWVVNNLDSWIAYIEKDYKRSLEVCEVAHDLNPAFPDNMWLFFLNYTKLNQGEKARDQLKAIARQFSGSDDYAAEIGKAYADKGIEGLFTCMIDIDKNRPVYIEGLNGNPFYIAWWYAVLGNSEEALYWLEKTLTQKFIPYQYVNLIIYHPDFEILHDQPRFKTIVDKLGLSAYWIDPHM